MSHKRTAVEHAKKLLQVIAEVCNSALSHPKVY